MRSAVFARRLARLVPFAPIVALAPLLGGCDSDSDRVCQDVTNCSHGGSDDWVTACRERADDVSHEATRSGCATAFDAYYSCAKDRFECHGNESVFPGCEATLAGLDRCLTAGRANNACGALDTQLSACGSAPPDAGTGDGTSLDACTTEAICSASCYLDSLSDVCAPSAAELATFADCASHCVY